MTNLHQLRLKAIDAATRAAAVLTTADNNRVKLDAVTDAVEATADYTIAKATEQCPRTLDPPPGTIPLTSKTQPTTPRPPAP